MIQQEHHSTRTETADTVVEVEVAAEADKVTYLHSMVVVVEKITTLKPSREPNNDSSNEIVPEIDGETFSSITCFRCQFKGHYKDKCPYATQIGIVSMHVGYTFTQGGLFNIPKGWLLLDTCSTCDVSNNPKLVTNIRR